MPVADKNGTAMIIKIKDIRPSRFGVAHASATVRSRPCLFHSSTENGFECCPLSTGLKQLASRRKRAPTESPIHCALLLTALCMIDREFAGVCIKNAHYSCPGRAGSLVGAASPLLVRSQRFEIAFQ